MNNAIQISGRLIGRGHPVYIIAEMSANHGQNFEDALRIVQAAKEAGADAVKLQTYTPDTITIESDERPFQIEGTIWAGRNLYELYREAYTPWEWQPKLKEAAEDMGLHCFSTPFDFTAVEFLEGMNVPAYKISSFELVDLELVRRVTLTGKPVIMSTGMASLGELDEAVATVRAAGGKQLALLKCTSAYPAPAEEMNLQTIPYMSGAFRVPVGLSDHTLDVAVPVAAVALGASLIEKHLTLSRNVPGPDSAFSLEPHEFKAMVDAIRTTEKALGSVSFTVTPHEEACRSGRRSLIVVKDMKAGERFTEANVRSIRPGHGLPPRFYREVLKSVARQDIRRATPLSWELLLGQVPETGTHVEV